VKQSITGLVLLQNLCFRFCFHAAILNAVPMPENVVPAAFISQAISLYSNLSRWRQLQIGFSALG
jgi:hypothetical protein